MTTTPRKVFFALTLGVLLTVGSPPAKAKRGVDMKLGMKVKVKVGDSTITVCRCPTDYGNCFCTPEGMLEEKEVGR